MTHWKVCDILKTLQGGTTSKSWLKNQKDSLTIGSIRTMTIWFKKNQWLSNSKRIGDYLVQKETVTSNSIRVSDYWFNKNYD